MGTEMNDHETVFLLDTCAMDPKENCPITEILYGRLERLNEITPEMINRRYDL